jgi:hypothetical protein
MIPTEPQDDTAAEMPDDAAAPVQPDPDRPPEAQPEPEGESDEEWMRRFIEENIHLASPRVVRPPEPPPQPWDGPRSQWKVPDHLSMPHPKGGYMAMALMSRTMDDLDEVTGGTRAATYEEVDKYFGHALIAEGLVPFTYTANEAIHWWKAGGYRVLGGGSAYPSPSLSAGPSSLAYDGARDAGTAFMVDPPAGNQAQLRPAVLFNEKPRAFAATPVEDITPAFTDDARGPLTTISSARNMARNPLSDMGERMIHDLNEGRAKLKDDLKMGAAKVAATLLNLNSKAANMLADSMRGPHSRDLTQGERRRVVEAFGSMIDLSDVKIVIGAGNNPIAKSAFGIGQNPAITIGNTVYINPDKVHGAYARYSSDFSKTDKGVEHLIHELYHVVQYQRHGFEDFGIRYGTEEAVFGPSSDEIFDRQAVYDYDKRSRKFDKETIEGQAEMAGRYAGLHAANKPWTWAERRQLEIRLEGSGIYGF